MGMLLPLMLLAAAGSADGQISAMFGNPIQAPNCESWSEWGPCVWLKGKEKRFQRSYFDQLLPGRKGCRNHVFFRLLKDRWGVVSGAFSKSLTPDPLEAKLVPNSLPVISCGFDDLL
ncbi:hypothetical protein ANCCAN_02186 [Ancylostoma caninum]|uniref:Uncharacterized protein n=1 Tax=Ancylostoma caninum TaxID=29170 RepID=A0A368H844_ANCCA|nr:hypothetical protein ANCCAN_02186 [Ancylostoma caninum]